MANSVQIKNLNHTHLAIIDWLVLNPERSLGECAKEMGFTQSWLSVVVHSDMFQAAYKEVCEQRHCEAVHTIVNELGGLAALGIAKMAEKIESGAASERLLTEATRTALEGLGYIGRASGGGASAQASVSIVVDPEKLRAARERARGRFEPEAGGLPLAEVVEVGSGQEGDGEVARPTPLALPRASIPMHKGIREPRPQVSLDELLGLNPNPSPSPA